MKERQKEKKQIAKGKGSTSISRRHATGNVHQRVNQKKPKGKFKKKGKCRKKRKNQEMDINA